MKNILIITTILFMLVSVNVNITAGSINTSNLIAYPNPFNPAKHGQVDIGFKPATASDYSGRVIIYNVNGDEVDTRSGPIGTSGTTITWNGRNARGSIVNPGLYVLRIKLDDDTDGDSAVKTVRLLVSY